MTCKIWYIIDCCEVHGAVVVIAEKVSVFRVFLVYYFPHLDWIRSFTNKYPYSVQMRDNTDGETPHRDTLLQK